MTKFKKVKIQSSFFSFEGVVTENYLNKMLLMVKKWQDKRVVVKTVETRIGWKKKSRKVKTPLPNSGVFIDIQSFSNEFYNVNNFIL